MSNIVTLVVISLIVCGVYKWEYTREFSRFTLLQPDSTVKVTYDIFNEFDDDKWTIVSTVAEYSVVLNSGRHYEWIDFLSKIEDFDKDSSVLIPTENIFFFIEKRPIRYEDLITIGNKVPNYPEFTQEDASIDMMQEHIELRSQYYKIQRNSIMAKAYYWAKTYRYHFPNEMTVYYENDDFVCYQLKQEPYYLNNLAVDYGYNIQKQE